MNCILIKLIRWYLKRKIAMLNRYRVSYAVDNAEYRRDGKSEDYWYGKADGVGVALFLLGLEDSF